VTAAVERYLDQLRKRAPDVADSPLAASALAMARELDSAGNSATAKSMCARSLHDAMDRLRELIPPDEETDQLDDLAARRATRLAGGSAA
jgi:hypothetical protein